MGASEPECIGLGTAMAFARLADTVQYRPHAEPLPIPIAQEGEGRSCGNDLAH
jgi:hypothetical protein